MNTINLVIRMVNTFAELAVAGMGVTVSKGKVKNFYPFYIHKSM